MSYTSLHFALSEELDMLRDSVRHFAEQEIAPYAAEIDQSNQFPPALWRKLGEMGLLGITVEEEYGGAHMGYLAHMIAMEEISRASASVALSYGAHSNLCVNQIRRNGTAAQKARMSTGSFTAGELSTPAETSTPYGRSSRIASPTFSGVSAPERISGLETAREGSTSPRHRAGSTGRSITIASTSSSSSQRASSSAIVAAS